MATLLSGQVLTAEMFNNALSDKLDAASGIQLSKRIETAESILSPIEEHGLVTTIITDATGLTQQQINDYNHVKSPEIFGAKGMTINDQAVFTNLSANHAYALAREYTVPVWRSPAKTIIGNNTKINVDSVNGDTTVAVQIPDNANY